MAKVMFKRIEDSADIDDTPIVDGQFIVTKDGKIYIDYGETRSEISGAGGGGSSAPVGTISQFAGNTIPEGWLACDGSAISRTTYASLFAKIGTIYGTGDGTSTFNLPNFNGRVPVGLDTTQTEFDTLGETGGEKYHTLTTNEIPSHSHGIGYALTGGSGSATAIMSYQPSSTFATDTAGGGQGHLNLQPYLTTNFIIKATEETPTEAEIVDTYSTSNTNGYSCSYVNDNIANILTTMKSLTLLGDWYTAFKPSGSHPMVIIPIFNPANSMPTTDFTSITIYDDTGNWVNCTVESKTYTKTQLVLTLGTTATTTAGKCYIARLQGTITCS